MISFPKEVYKEDEIDDANPSIRMFGRRFCDDQQVMDLLSEFLLVATSEKKVFDRFKGYLPRNNELLEWREQSRALLYYPKCRINLKLFSFLSSSPLATRHAIHRQHGDELLQLLSGKLDLEDENEKRDFLQTLSSLLLGFWGTGAKRTWCAQTFYPFCRTSLCAEVIWKAIPAKREKLTSWQDMLDGSRFSNCFGLDQHVVFCRGGEALFLQMCNALTQTKEEVAQWIEEREGFGVTLGLRDDERDPQKLRDQLEKLFGEYFSHTESLEKVMEFVDSGVDSATAYVSDRSGDDDRSIKCGWIPRESWREGYLFAVEIKRVLAAKIGVMETADMLMIACAMQVMRTLATQSYRHSQVYCDEADGFDYRILVCDSMSRKRKLKKFSTESLSEIVKVIQQAIRTEETIDRVRKIADKEVTPEKREKKFSSVYKDADSYGFKLYRKLGKSIGLIVPQTGRWMRYTLNDKILRYLIISLIPNERMTLETFKAQMEAHHGFVFDLERLKSSRNWMSREAELKGTESTNAFLERMLDASGVLVRLSDSCSLVKNPYTQMNG